MKRYIELVLIFAVMFVFDSCSKLQNNALSPAASQSVIHPSGWAMPSSANFHGTYIQSHKYDMTTCASCHGSDLSGGTAKVSCYKCHDGADGTLACSTCHGSSVNAAPPKDLAGDSLTTGPTGAHQTHLMGLEEFDKVSCSSCHVVPQAAGLGLHPGGNGVSVSFSGVALNQSNVPGSQDYVDTLATVMPSPVFNPQTLQCANTYCHGNFRGGNNFSPKWTILDGSQDSCGSCHGTPPKIEDHPQTVFGQNVFYNGPTSQNCYLCHEPMMGQSGIQDSSLHANGSLELQGRSLSPW